MSLTRRAVNLAPTVSQLATGVPAARALNLAAPGKPAEHGHGHGLAAGRGDKVPRWAASHSVGLAGVTVNSKVNGEVALRSPAQVPLGDPLNISHRLATRRADRCSPIYSLCNEQSPPPGSRFLLAPRPEKSASARLAAVVPSLVHSNNRVADGAEQQSVWLL